MLLVVLVIIHQFMYVKGKESTILTSNHRSTTALTSDCDLIGRTTKAGDRLVQECQSRSDIFHSEIHAGANRRWREPAKNAQAILHSHNDGSRSDGEFGSIESCIVPVPRIEGSTMNPEGGQ